MSTSAPTRRLPILFTGANRAMAVLGLRPGNSYVEIHGTEITIRMGWAFRATVARTAVAAIADDHDRVLGWGVHGWRGRWLVNGSSSNIVRIDLDPPGRGRVCGVPVRLGVVRVSVAEPAALIDALS